MELAVVTTDVLTGTDRVRALVRAGITVIDAPAPGPASIAPPAPRYHRAPDLVGMIMSRASEPWCSLTLGGDELVRVRPGGMAVVMGPTGAGKSSLVVGILIEHARDRGPVVVLSRELPADELAARAIGMLCDASWPDVLTGRVPLSEMERVLGLPRMIVLDRRDATLRELTIAIEDIRAECPGEPVVIAIDYIQILESGERDARAKVADVIAQIDEIARAHRAVVIAISQMSRAASRAARGGEAVGADSTDGGAESAAIERAATVTLCIGSSGPDREDGTRAVDLSIGKGRMTGGDRVIPMSYCGRSGRWRVTGDARPAGEVKAERQQADASAAQTAAELALEMAATKATEPLTQADLIAKTGGNRKVATRAVRALLDRGDLVEVRQRKPRASAWKVWTRARAEAAGVPIVEVEPCD